ncbi:MAG: cadherin-like beta sandwich domain-containing protein [Polyangia bacterium]
MRRICAVFCVLLLSLGLGGLGLLGGSGCSSDGTSCPAGQVTCGSSCVAAQTPCTDGGLPDLATEDPSLASLVPTSGQLSPAFQPSVTMYTLSLSAWVGSIQVQATPVDARATLTLGGALLTAGTPSAPIQVTQAPLPLEIQVRTPGGATRSYTVVVTRAPSTYVKAGNTGAGDTFGSVVALSGDTLAVGAPAEDSSATGVGGDPGNNGATNSGAVYVFVRSGASWVQQAYLKASNTEGGDNFGESLALSGDTLAVGAPAEDSGATGVGGDPLNNARQNSGAVFVFLRTGTTWAQQAYLKASNTGASDQFGQSLALSGDTLAVGAPGEDSNATGTNGTQTDNSASGSGAVYVFLRTGSAWAQQAYLKASNTDPNDQFGQGLALSGDTLAVGARLEDSSALGTGGAQSDNATQDSGAVYVFARAGTTWAQQAYLKASNTGASDQLGVSVALSGSTLAASAPLEDSNATGIGGAQSDNSAQDSGAVYVF